MDINYKWELETGSKKHICPHCKRKSLTKYVVKGTKTYLGDDFGWCDHQNSCTYHKFPEKDFKGVVKPVMKKELPPPKRLIPERDFIQRLLNSKPSVFYKFCNDTLGISKDHLTRWQVGAKGKFTAFVLSESKGESVNVKFIAYACLDNEKDCKRDKSIKTNGNPVFIPHYLGKSYLKSQGIETEPVKLEGWQDFYSFDRCFYGEHLWEQAKDTCLVESEKTAVLASYFFPKYNWLSTGGNNGMRFKQFEIFYGYTGRIWNLVDNDKAGLKKSKTIQWLDTLATMRDDPNEILSVNLFPEAVEGWDLADAIIHDDYRNPGQFDMDLKDAFDYRQRFDIDVESGEIKGEPLHKSMVADEKEFRRANQVADRIFEAKVNIMEGKPETGTNIMQAIASFGERGRPIAYKIGEAAGMSEEAVESIFEIAINNPQNTTKLFFEGAKAAGIETRFIKSIKSSIAEGSEGAAYQDEVFHWPDGLEDTEDFDPLMLKKQIHTYNFIEFKNRIWYANRRKETTFNKISNFVIRPLYLIKSKTDPKRLFEVKNVHGKKYILDIPAKSMVSLSEFQVFCESQGNFLFEGNRVEFINVKRKLYDLTKDAEEIKTLGWQSDGFYAFANGSFGDKFRKVDEHGIIKHLVNKGKNEAEEKYFFIPAMSNIYKDEKDQFELEKKFVYVNRPDVSFSQWSQLFYKTYRDNGIIAMAFYLSSLFRDLIYSKFKFFPHLFHFGPAGTGKSTLSWSIQFMFGLERKPFMLNSGTAVGFYRTFAQFRNAVVWFDEYKNTIDFKRIQDLKSAYDGAGHVKGEWSASGGSSNRTITTAVESACNISGQELPNSDNALFKRVILLQYYQTTFSSEEKEDLSTLINMQEKGLSHITAEFTKYRRKVEELYFSVFDSVEIELLDRMNNDPFIETRIVKNMAVIATTFKILENEFPWPWKWDELLNAMVANIKDQNTLISNAKETNQFWEVIEFCISQGDLKENSDYKIEHQSSVTVTINGGKVEKRLPKLQKVIYIRMSTFHPKYMEALKRQGEKKGMDRGSLIHYLSHSPGYIGHVSSTKFIRKEGSIKHEANTSAYAFEYEHIKKQGYSLDQYEDDEYMDPVEVLSTPTGSKKQPEPVRIHSENEEFLNELDHFRKEVKF